MTFDLHQFIADCQAAVAADPTHKTVREVVARAVSEPGSVIAALGAPQRAGLNVLYNSPDLTLMNLVWGPGMSIMPHDHRMWAVIGIYTGREDNVFWRRLPKESGREVEAAGARSLCVGDCCALGTDIIHSVLNPIARLTGAIHVYGGDFVAQERSAWDAETLREQPYDSGMVRQLFEQSNRLLTAQ
jgi:predicted metal-dependent enzyme (double-stranded beta helix superfamily)